MACGIVRLMDEQRPISSSLLHSPCMQIVSLRPLRLVACVCVLDQAGEVGCVGSALTGRLVDCEGGRNCSETDVEAGLGGNCVSGRVCSAEGLLFLHQSSRSRVHGCRGRASRGNQRPGVAGLLFGGTLDEQLCVLLVRVA